MICFKFNQTISNNFLYFFIIIFFYFSNKKFHFYLTYHLS